MIALDTNVLVAARREEAAHHVAARDLLATLASGPEPWAIPWPCIYEFLRVVTHARGFQPPTRLGDALEDLDGLLASPSLRLLSAGPAHGAHFSRQILAGEASGDLVFDAHIATLCIEHGVTELLTLDRDFARFPAVRARNPFN